MIAHAVTVPSVPPIVRVARTYMQATARAAGDTSLQAGYSWSPDELTAAAFGRTVDRGVLRPARIPGVPDWSCGAARAGKVTCRVSVASDAWVVNIRYVARGGRGEISMSLVAR
ncbi:MAG: hypothetical protein AB7O78_01580 [Thermoleophilia bacterium]